MKVGDVIKPYVEQYQPDVVLSLPLPNRNLTGQLNIHKMVKAKSTASYREIVGNTVRAQRFPGFKGKVRIHHVWLCGLTPVEKAHRSAKVPIKKQDGAYRPDDEGNAIAAIKAAIDGIVDAGLFRGDTRHDVCFGDFIKLSTEKEHHGFYGLVLMVKEVGS